MGLKYSTFLAFIFFWQQYDLNLNVKNVIVKETKAFRANIFLYDTPKPLIE